jgi:hypothetical protein
MTLLIPPGFAQAAFRYSLIGDPQIMVTTLGFDLNSYGGDFEAAATDIRDGWAAGVGDEIAIGNQWSWVDVVLRIGQDGGPPAVVTRVANVVGADSTGHLPQNNTLLIHKTTLLGGRRGRGRMYLPSAHLPESAANDAGVLPDVISSGYTTLMEQSRVAWDADGAEPVLLHDAGVGAAAPTSITSFACDRMIATQRRRLRR